MLWLRTWELTKMCKQYLWLQACWQVDCAHYTFDYLYFLQFLCQLSLLIIMLQHCQQLRSGLVGLSSHGNIMFPLQTLIAVLQCYYWWIYNLANIHFYCCMATIVTNNNHIQYTNHCFYWCMSKKSGNKDSWLLEQCELII